MLRPDLARVGRGYSCGCYIQRLCPCSSSSSSRGRNGCTAARRADLSRLLRCWVLLRKQQCSLVCAARAEGFCALLLCNWQRRQLLLVLVMVGLCHFGLSAPGGGK